MFDVLVYLFENYYTPKSCPSVETLSKRLLDAGFDDDEIDDALSWLYGLAKCTEQFNQLMNISADATRIFTHSEEQQLGTQAIGFLHFLEHSGALTPALREIVIERALATQEMPIELEHFKIITLMVLWNQEADIDYLILEELLISDKEKRLH